MSESLSIIIPAYNEASRIGASLAEVLRFGREWPAPVEVLVVDDGSTDDTLRIVETAAARAEATGPGLRLVRHRQNRGKGASVRSGFASATKDIVLFTDADLSAPMSEAPKLIEAIVSGRCDVAIGSRALDRTLITVHQSIIRRNSGRIFNRMVRCLTGLDLFDTQCGFKAFRRLPMQPAFARQQIEGFAFDVELLYLASRLGLRILEMPVRWDHVPDSKVSLAADSARMFVDLCRIRWNDCRGLYAWETPAE